MSRTDELLEIMRSCRPPGYFDHVESLLRAYVDKIVEHEAMMTDARRHAKGSVERIAVVADAAWVLDEAVDMAGALGLLPGDALDNLPPPRLQ
jgi:hypothetical protein